MLQSSGFSYLYEAAGLAYRKHMLAVAWMRRNQLLRSIKKPHQNANTQLAPETYLRAFMVLGSSGAILKKGCEE